MSRAALPNRRHGDALMIEHNGARFRLQVNEYPDGGRLAEVFVNAPKVDSEIDALSGDIAILISMLLQFGVAPALIGHALRRNPSGSRASLVGVIVDALVDIDAGDDPRAMVRRTPQREAAE